MTADFSFQCEVPSLFMFSRTFPIPFKTSQKEGCLPRGSEEPPPAAAEQTTGEALRPRPTPRSAAPAATGESGTPSSRRCSRRAPGPSPYQRKIETRSGRAATPRSQRRPRMLSKSKQSTTFHSSDSRLAGFDFQRPHGRAQSTFRFS